MNLSLSGDHYLHSDCTGYSIGGAVHTASLSRHSTRGRDRTAPPARPQTEQRTPNQHTGTHKTPWVCRPHAQKNSSSNHAHKATPIWAQQRVAVGGSASRPCHTSRLSPALGLGAPSRKRDDVLLSDHGVQMVPNVHLRQWRKLGEPARIAHSHH